ncbi:translation initiation factor eIF4A [Podila epicladia]|nr:translation initiation factor eIF4A [Podila epicladia]
MSSESGPKQDPARSENDASNQREQRINSHDVPRMQAKHGNINGKGDSAQTQSSNSTNHHTPTPPSNSRPSPRLGSKPKRGSSTSRGGGSLRSPSTRVTITSGEGEQGDSKKLSASMEPVGLGVTTTEGSNKTSNHRQADSETQHSQTQGHGGEHGSGVHSGPDRNSHHHHPQSAYPRGRSGRFSTGDRPTNSHFASSQSGLPRFSSRGGRQGSTTRGEGEDSRGRKYDRKTVQDNASHLTNSTGDASKTVENNSAESDKPEEHKGNTETATGSRPPRQREPQVVSEIKKTQHTTRSPRPPRSPRRGFNERGSEPSNGSQTLELEGCHDGDSVQPSSTQPSHSSDIIADKDAGSAKKRKPKKSKKKDEGESSTATLNGALKEEDGKPASSEVTSKEERPRPPSVHPPKSTNQSTEESDRAWVSKSQAQRLENAQIGQAGPRNTRESNTTHHSGNSSGTTFSRPPNSRPRRDESGPYAGKGNWSREHKDSHFSSQRQGPRREPGDSLAGDGWSKPHDNDADKPIGWEPKESTTAADGWGEPSKSEPGQENNQDAKEVKGVQTDGWGDPSKLDVAAVPTGWGDAPATDRKWGEDIPWERTGDTSNKSDWQDHRGHTSERGRGASFVGRGRGRGDARFPNVPFQGRHHGSHDPRERGFNDPRSSLGARTSRQEARGVRPSIASRAFDKGEQGPKPKAIEDSISQPSAKDEEKAGQRSKTVAANVEMQRTPSHGSADVRLDPRYNKEADTFRPNQRNGPSQASKSFSSQYDVNSPSGSQSDVQRRPRNQDGSVPRKPTASRSALFSTSLECQMSWEAMDLKPSVLSSIRKAGLTRVSNIQKLAMKPIGRGKDVIAQSQSQKDRTNTLAIALLQKVSAENKACQAILICSGGVDPQKVYDDLQVWFMGSGISCIYLKDPIDVSLLAKDVPKQVVVATLGPLREILNNKEVPNKELDIKAVETGVVLMRTDEIFQFAAGAFEQVWGMIPRSSQKILMTGHIGPKVQQAKELYFREDAAVLRADELTLQWSEHYHVNVESPDARWDVLVDIFDKNAEISHVVIVTQSQSVSETLANKLSDMNLPVHAVWSMADKTDTARMFNSAEKCILVAESKLLDHLDLDHFSLVINYDVPKKATHYIDSFGPFGRSGLRTMMINFVQMSDPSQQRVFNEMESLYSIKIKEMKC